MQYGTDLLQYQYGLVWVDIERSKKGRKREKETEGMMKEKVAKEGGVREGLGRGSKR